VEGYAITRVHVANWQSLPASRVCCRWPWIAGTLLHGGGSAYGCRDSAHRYCQLWFPYLRRGACGCSPKQCWCCCQKSKVETLGWISAVCMVWGIAM